MKQNDWIVANINNPDFTTTDFKEISGLNLTNTLFLPKDEYKKSKFITENPLFLNQEGQFNEKLFDQFYELQANKFNEFVEDDSIYEREYNFWDVRAGIDSKVRDFNFKFINVSNPDRTTFGISGRNIAGDRKLSKSELALTQKIRDFETGLYLDETPNNYALFNHPLKYIQNLFSGKNLVLATYDEDGEHVDPITGFKIHHSKGEPILNDQGTYFTETLGDRSPRNKDFITKRDLITVDGTKINKYDFLDTDSISKDPWKVVADTIASVLPMVVLGPYGLLIYSGLIITRELAKSVPMLAGMTTAFADQIGLDVNGNQDISWANKISGIGQSFSRGTSEYAKEHMFSFENFGNLISDVALQWGQQKTIIKAITKLKANNAKIINSAYEKAAAEYATKADAMLKDAVTGKMSMDKAFFYTGVRTSADAKGLVNAKKWSETPLGKAALQKFLPQAEAQVYKANKIGQDLSLAYMAIISNTDVYDDAIQRGATHKEAAAIALGSTLGMFGVDKYLGLGEMFFDDAKAELRRDITQQLKLVSKEVTDDFLAAGGKEAVDGVRKPVYKIIQEMMGKTKKTLTEYAGGIKDRSLGFMGKAIGEGLEEVSEEVVTDLTKSLAEIAGDYGYMSVNDFGAFENVLPRYAMNFIGGFLGGGMFYAVDVFNNPKSFTQKVNRDLLIYLVSTGKTNTLLSLLDTKFKKRDNIYGNYDLSFSTEDGTFVTADETHKSQAETVYNTIRNMIVMYDNILNNHNLKASEDELFDRLILSEAKFRALKDVMQGASYFTYYQQNYQTLVKDIVDLQTEIDRKTNSDNLTEQAKLEISNLQLELNEKLKLRDEYLSGQKSLDYLDKLMWIMDPEASGPYIQLTKEQFSRKMFGANYDELSDVEKQTLDRRYEAYTKGTVKDEINLAWNKYKEFRKRISSTLEGLSQNDFLDLEKFLEQEKEQIRKFKPDINPNLRLEGYSGIFGNFEEETEEQFNAREQQEGETDDLFNERRRLRAEHYAALQNQRLIDNINSLLSNVQFIDSNTARKIQQTFVTRIKDVSNLIFNAYKDEIYNIVNEPTVGPVQKYLNIAILDAVESVLGSYLSDINFALNLDLDTIRLNVESRIKSSLKESLKELTRSYAYIENGASRLKIPVTLEDESAPEVIDPSYKISELKQNPNFIPGTPEYNSLNKTGKTYVDKIISDLFTNPEFDDLTLSEVLDEINDTADLVKTLTDQIMDNIKEILNNAIVKLLKETGSKLSIDRNPAIELIKQVATRTDLSDEFNDIEQALQVIYNLYQEGKTPELFTLTDPLTTALKNALDLLDKTKGIIYSSTVEESLTNPIGQHKQLNKIIADHSDLFSDVNPLPEFEEHVGNSLLYEINKYQTEIRNWLELSESHKGNRIALINAQQDALVNTRLKFLETLSGLKLTVGDLTVNILDNFDKGNNDIEALVKNQALIKKNFEKAVNKYMEEYHVTRPKAVRAIFNQIFDQNIFRDGGTLIEQKITPLDENLEYGKLSDYDKFIYLITNLLGDEVSFYNDLIEYTNNSKEAPLFTQIYGEYILSTHQENPEEIAEILDLVKEKYNIDIPVVDHLTIVTGIAGSGKSSVEAKFIASKYDPAKIAVIGPSLTQAANLAQIIPNLSEKLIFNSLDDANKYFFDDDVLSKIQGRLNILGKPEQNKDTNIYSIGQTHEEDRDLIIVVKDETLDTSFFKNLKDEEIPELIIIDESTYLAHPYILLYSKLAKKKGINIILIGDEAQSGHPGLSIEKEAIFGIRTPRLDLSLRAENVHQFYNLKLLSNIFNTNIIDNYNPKKVWQLLSNVQFSYFLDDSNFTGTAVIKPNEIDQFILAIKAQVKPDENILFVGENSTLISKLQDSGLNITMRSEKDVQGQEANFVIVDVDWATTKDERGGRAYVWSKKLNTLTTRSKKGTIVIDNGLTDTIKQSLQSTVNTEILSFTKDQIKELKLKFISQLLFLKNMTSEESVSSAETEPEPEEINVETNLGDGTSSFVSKEKSDTTNSDVFETSSGSYRMYGNISTLGVEREQVKARRRKGQDTKYPLFKWKKEKGTTKRDVGIFMDKDVVKGSDKENLVFRFMTFKNFLIHYLSKETDQDKADYLETMKSIYDHNILSVAFGRNTDYSEILKNAKYFVEAKTLEEGYDSFIGMTTANDKESTNEEKGSTIDINGKQKFVRVYVEFNVNGKTHQVTLGAVANPRTWETHLDDIATAESEKTGESVSSIKERILKEIELYKQQLKKLDTTPVIEIDPINFTSNLEAYSTAPFRLANLYLFMSDEEVEEIKQVNGQYIVSRRVDSDEFQRRSLGYIVSDVYIITNKENKNAGKYAVIYVTSDPTLSKDELMSKYTPDSHNIRMFILDNLGIDFTSLVLDDWKQIYKGNSSKDSADIPTNLRQFGARMYESIWNFRARLGNFLELCSAFEQENGINFSDKNIQDLLQKESDLYQEYKSSDKSLSFDEYLKDRLSDEEYNIYQKIKTFNEEGLKSNQEFRVGTDSKSEGSRIGLYIRTLVNSKSWTKTGQDEYGIYINPKLARQYYNVLNKLFEELNKVVLPNENVAITDIIDLHNIDKEDTWFKQLQGRKLRFIDENGNVNSFNINAGTISVLPLIMKEILKKSKQYTKMGKGSFMLKYNKNEFRITINDEYGDVISEIDYLSLFDLLEDGLQSTIWYDETGTIVPETKTLGVTNVYDKKGSVLGTRDVRMKNLFKVMFHGLTWTEKFNDFTNSEPRAYVADFKNGIFVDPLIISNSTSLQDDAALVSTDPRFFSIDVTFGAPIGYFGFTKSELNNSSEPTSQEVVENAILVDNKITEILNQLPDKFKKDLTGYTNLEDFVDALNRELGIQFNPNQRNIKSDNVEDTYLYADNQGNLIKLTDYIKNKLNVNTVKFIDYSDEGTLIFETENGNIEFDYSEYKLGEDPITTSNYMTVDLKIKAQEENQSYPEQLSKRLDKFIKSVKNKRDQTTISGLTNLVNGFGANILGIRDELEHIIKRLSDPAVKLEAQNIINEINDNQTKGSIDEKSCLIWVV